MKIDIVDDFLTDYQHQSLLRTFALTDVPHGIVSNPFPWYFYDNVNGEERLGNYYFNSIILDGYKIRNPSWLPVFIPLVSKLNVPLEAVGRIKANLYPRTQWRVHHKSHVDYLNDSKQIHPLTTCLYYLNGSNRVTVFDGKREVKSKPNRAIFFEGIHRHHSTTPTDVNCGISINIDYNKS